MLVLMCRPHYLRRIVSLKPIDQSLIDQLVSRLELKATTHTCPTGYHLIGEANGVYVTYHPKESTIFIAPTQDAQELLYFVEENLPFSQELAHQFGEIQDIQNTFFQRIKTMERGVQNITKPIKDCEIDFASTTDGIETEHLLSLEP